MRRILIAIVFLIAILASSLGSAGATPHAHYERPSTKAGPYKERVIVFVHGLFGDADSSWRYSSSVYWPRLLLDDPVFADSDIYVAGYSTPRLGNTMNVDEVVTSLRNRMVNDGVFSNHREVVFVCHSLGGVIIQRLLLTFRDYSSQVPFIYFFSTPQTGAQIASLAAVFSSDPLIKALFAGDENSYLQNLENEWKAAGFHIRRFCAYEKKSYKGILVVDRLSGTRNCDEPPIPIDEDHLGIVKPSGVDHDSYVALRNAVRANPISAKPKLDSGGYRREVYPAPIEKTLRFTVMVPFDTALDSTPIPLDENPDDPLFRTYAELNGLASNGTIPESIRDSQESGQITWKPDYVGQADVPQFLGRLLQYYIFRSIDGLQKDTLTVALGYPASARAGISVPDAMPYRDESFFRQLADNPFFQPFRYRISGDAMAWKTKPISMPAGTKIKLIEDGDKSKKYIVRLERPGYFRIEYSVESPFGTGLGSVPNHFRTSKSATTMQWAFFVTMRYSIQNRTDGRFNPSSYSAWVDALYTGLHGLLSSDEVGSAKREPNVVLAAPYGNLANRCRDLGQAIVDAANEREKIMPRFSAPPTEQQKAQYYQWYRENDGIVFHAHFWGECVRLQRDLRAVNITDSRLDELLQRHAENFERRNREVEKAVEYTPMYHCSIDEIRETGERFLFLASQVPGTPPRSTNSASITEDYSGRGHDKVEARAPTAAEIQIEARSLTREATERFSNAMNGIKWWAQIPSGGSMIEQEWKRFEDDYNRNLKDRMVTMYRLLQGRITNVPRTGIDTERAFNPPALHWSNVQDQLKILFAYLNEFEKENGLTITKWG
jgi:pimeloyl-ACP methyl ester carboxylesterase